MPCATASATASSDALPHDWKSFPCHQTMFLKPLYRRPSHWPKARSFATPLLRSTPSHPPVSIGSRKTTIPAFAVRRIIASALAKYAGFGVERSPGFVNGLIPSYVVPSDRHPVYVAHSRSISSELKPAA